MKTNFGTSEKKNIINTPIWKKHQQMTFAPNLKRDFEDNETDCSYTKVCSATQQSEETTAKLNYI